MTVRLALAFALLALSAAADPVPKGAKSIPTLQPEPPGGLPVIDLHVVDAQPRTDPQWAELRATVEGSVRALNSYWISQSGERFVKFRLKALLRREEVLKASCDAANRLESGDERWTDALPLCPDPRLRDPAAMNVVIKFAVKGDSSSFGSRLNGKPFVTFAPHHVDDFEKWIHEFGHALGGLPHTCSNPRPPGTEWNIMASTAGCTPGAPIVTGYFFSEAQAKKIRASVKAAVVQLKKPEPPPAKLPEGLVTLDLHFTILADTGLDDDALEQLLAAKVEFLNRTFAGPRGVPPFRLKMKGFAPPAIVGETACTAVRKLADGNAKWDAYYRDCKDPRVRDVTAVNVLVYRPSWNESEPSRGASAWNRPYVLLNVEDLDDDAILAREIGRAFGLGETCGDGAANGVNVMETAAACRRKGAPVAAGPVEGFQAESLAQRAAEFSVLVEESRAKGSDRLPKGAKSERELRRGPGEMARE